MLATKFSTQCLAGRIRRAYVCRRPWWPTRDAFGAAWSAASQTLIELHLADPWLPLDPEFFVASQPRSEAVADPWGELVGPAAARRYRRRVLGIVRSLRRELRAELRRLERSGPRLDRLVLERTRRVSALGRYVAAVRAGRSDLAAAIRDEAQQQHRSCPLYRLACVGLIPETAYPAPDRRPAATVPLFLPPVTDAYAWN